jgi:uncharacterized protein
MLINRILKMKNFQSNLITIIIGIILTTTIVSPLSAQNLNRRAYLGVSSIALNDSLKTVTHFISSDGVYITTIHSGGTAESIGLREGDIITHIDEDPIPSPQSLNQKMLTIYAGDTIELSFSRNGEEKSITTTAKTWPVPDRYDNRYLEVPFDTGYLRAVLSVPRNVENPPVVYFVQGIGCGSIYYLPAYHPYKRIPEQFVGEGYAVFFIEKPGAGDSKGTPACAEIGFDYELRAFEEGYRYLNTLEGINTGEVYIFGHSFGGVHAPVLAEQFHPKGVIVYGTAIRAWMDYLIELRRYQGVWMGEDYADVNESLHDLRKTYHQLFYNKKSPKELYEEEPYKSVLAAQLGYQGEGNALFGRDYTFHMEANRINLDLHWKNTHTRVLAVYGEADIEALYPYDHERIAEVVNHYRPGTAEFWLYPETDHALVKVGMLLDGWKIRSEGGYARAMQERYNEQVIKDVVAWMKR